MLLEQGGSEKRQKIVKAHLLQRPSQVHCFMLLREYWQPLTSGWLLLQTFEQDHSSVYFFLTEGAFDRRLKGTLTTFSISLSLFPGVLV